MTFTSPLFLFLFLPALLACYFLLGKRYWNLTLLLSGWLFYIWGEWAYSAILIFFIVANYLFALYLNKCGDDTNKLNRKRILIGAIALNLSVLVFLKYSNFLIGNLNIVLSTLGISQLAPVNIHSPLGISFITFTAISYIVDIYRKVSLPQANPYKLAFYLSFFPKLISGPLERYRSIDDQLSRRTIDMEIFASGISRFIIGLAKKMLIANTVGSVVDQIFSVPAGQLPAATAWLGIICFSIQLYFDFSGYTDMAIGLARMFGFNLMENFNYPYISLSIREFWRRWHISMSQWFRDYLYIPLGGNRHGAIRTYLNLLIVFLLCGLWHGASWTFVAWGLWYGMFMILERTQFLKLINPVWRPLRHIYTLLVIIIGWVFFRSANLTYAVSYIAAMSGFFTVPNAAYDAAVYINPAVVIALIAGIIGSLPLIPAINNYIQYIEQRLTQPAAAHYFTVSLRAVSVISLFVIFIAEIILVFSASNRPFLYSQF